MIQIEQHATIDQALAEAARRYAGLPLLALPPNPARAHRPEGCEASYRVVVDEVRALADAYASAGYGVGDRVALLLDNRLEHFVHKLALNAIGACAVPLDPDHRAAELAYVLGHAQPALVVAVDERVAQVEAAFGAGAAGRPIVALSQAGAALPRAPAPARRQARTGPETPASILYTSGTTGRPKGCVLSQRYELAAGRAYATRGGLATLGEGAERIYNPLPLFHVNASILSFWGALLTGSCQVQSERFSPTRWWPEVAATRATVVHYLGVIVPLLMAQPPGPADRAHAVRIGLGAGVEPQLHAAFEQRYGFPLLELWGMTEMVRVLVDCVPPRQVGTRAFGRPVEGVEVRVVDDAGAAVAAGAPGELLIRHSAATPRRDFFSGYLDDPEATEEAWRGGWFHTGDVVVQDETGMLHFVDRRKNIIRRAGENIAAAEVEAQLQSDPRVLQVAVLAVADELREEEVLACIVAREAFADGAARRALAQELFDACRAALAYYKAPGWIWFTDALPVTGTQKIRKHALFPAGADPRTLPGMIDLRPRKRRD